MLSHRYAEADDLPIVAVLYKMALDELKDILPVKPDDENIINCVLTNWACAPCILLEKGSEIVGFYGLTTFKPKYSNDAVLGDYMLFILKEHRTYKAAKMLALAARDVADRFNLPLDLNFIAPGDFRAKSRFLENMGAKIVGVKAVYYGR